LRANQGRKTYRAAGSRSLVATAAEVDAEGTKPPEFDIRPRSARRPSWSFGTNGGAANAKDNAWPKVLLRGRLQLTEPEHVAAIASVNALLYCDMTEQLWNGALRLDTEEIVTKYIDAWNQQDVSGLLRLMHAGAAYYDAFWSETCVGQDLARYLQDAMEEEPYWYKQVGDTIGTENGVLFRYSAHLRSGSKAGEPVLYGAEILSLRDEKILTVTDIYCSPERSDLEAVAKLSARRHGLPSHVDSGLGALKTARITAKLSAGASRNKFILDPEITMAQLAENIGCTLDQLFKVIEKQFGSSPGQFLDSRRVEYARQVLEKDPDCLNILDKVATSAGFKSVVEFSRKFSDIVGVTPEEFCRLQKQATDSRDNYRLH
jgi:AraC-like DNA-binding protein